jgi:hypothetical protein
MASSHCSNLIVELDMLLLRSWRRDYSTSACCMKYDDRCRGSSYSAPKFLMGKNADEELAALHPTCQRYVFPSDGRVASTGRTIVLTITPEIVQNCFSDDVGRVSLTYTTGAGPEVE